MVNASPNVVKVFSSTKAGDRVGMGDEITSWLNTNPDIEILDKIVVQSSDNSYHCLSIVLFCKFDKKCNKYA